MRIFFCVYTPTTIMNNRLPNSSRKEEVCKLKPIPL